MKITYGKWIGAGTILSGIVVAISFIGKDGLKIAYTPMISICAVLMLLCLVMVFVSD